MQEPTPKKPLNTAALIPLLKSNAAALAALDPPIKHPLSLLSTLTALPPPPPYTLPSGDIIYPPEPAGIPPRKLVIFGDCSGGTKNAVFQQMCEDPSLLVHECTNAAIPELVQRGNKGKKARTREVEPGLKEKAKTDQDFGAVGKQPSQSENDTDVVERLKREEADKAEVRRKALSRGHSTPDEVGAFARSIRARRVVVNHFSAMYVASRSRDMSL